MAVDVLGPIQGRIDELERELDALRKAEAAITGGTARRATSNGRGTSRVIRKASGGKRKGKRRRLSDEQKLKIGEAVYKKLHTAGDEYKASELETFTHGFPVRKIVEIWNKANKDKKINVKGEKATTRYHVA